jgi:hypothetical protein
MINEKKRIENSEEVTYIVENESHDDDYGSLIISYVPYRIDSKGNKKRLSPESYALDRFEAEQYITIKKYIRCEHCNSVIKTEYL